MGKNYYLRWTALFVLMVSVFASCQKEFDKYYELPSWMKGNAWEVLQSEGNYTIFLAGIEKGGFKEMVDGKGILTVMAPDDNAFKAYLNAKGYASIDQMPLDELKATVNYHLLYYSYNKEQMANNFPFGTDNAALYMGMEGLFYKFRTHSQDPYEYNVPDLAVGATTLRTVYHKERFLPIFSSYLFGIKGDLDAKYNYEYFYPNSTWTGDNGGFNVSNASVTEYAIPTDAGYVYKISEVLTPLETVGKQLDREADYSLFASAYDRFKIYAYDDQNTALYSPDDSLWLKLHVGLPPIAAEWAYNGAADQWITATASSGGSTVAVPDYALLPHLASYAINAFAPNNNAMANFLGDYWSADYASYQDLPFLPLQALLQNHVNFTVGETELDLGIAFPESISEGAVKTAYGNTVNFNPNATLLKKMGSNGALYGLDHVMAPDVFYSVAGPLFKYRRFLMMLHMLGGATADASGLPLGLWLSYPSYDMNDNLGGKLMMFLSTDDMFTINTTYGGGELRYNTGNPNLAGTAAVQMTNSNGDWVAFSGSGVVMRNHVVTADMAPTRTLTEGKIYKTLYDRNYLWVKDDSVMSTATYNIVSGGGVIPVPTFRRMSEFTAYNGDVYELEGEEASALVPEVTNLMAQLLNPASILTQYKEFISLFVSSGMLADFVVGNNFLVFAPSNDVIIAGLDSGEIPPKPHTVPSGGTLTPDQEAENVIRRADLQRYIKRYFMNANISFPIDYPFVGALDRTLASPANPTMQSFAQISDDLFAPYIPFGISDNGSNLVVIDEQGNQINVTAVFPNVYMDGAAYPIDGLIKLAGE